MAGTNVPRTFAPGKGLRFAVVASDGTRSATWRVWTARNTNDAYIAARNIAGVQKTSLHASGSWSNSFINDAAAQLWGRGSASRHLSLWQRPDEFLDGWTHAYSILIPDSELRPWPSNAPPEKGDVVRVPSPGPGLLAAVEILLARPTDVSIELGEVVDVGCLWLPDGTTVRVISRKAELPPDMPAAFHAARLTASEGAPAAAEEPGLRISLHGVDPTNNVGFVYEVAGSGSR